MLSIDTDRREIELASWKTKALSTLRRHVEQGTVQFTEKANHEVAALNLHASEKDNDEQD